MYVCMYMCVCVCVCMYVCVHLIYVWEGDRKGGDIKIFPKQIFQIPVSYFLFVVQLIILNYIIWVFLFNELHFLFVSGN